MFSSCHFEEEVFDFQTLVLEKLLERSRQKMMILDLIGVTGIMHQRREITHVVNMIVFDRHIIHAKNASLADQAADRRVTVGRTNYLAECQCAGNHPASIFSVHTMTA